jgi:hypothetical protein
MSKYTYPSRYRDEGNFSDPSDTLAQQGYLIEIEHVPSGQRVSFKAFITSFNDTYSPNWTPEEVYGRADPIYNYKNTTRSITINFKLPAASESEAYANLAKVQKLAQFNYPNYSTLSDCDGVESKTVSQAPLLRLKFMNFIRSTKGIIASEELSEREIYSSYNNGGEGILGFFSNITYNFNLENDNGGGFRVFDQENNKAQYGTLVPRLIDVTLGNFSPIHDHHLGWDENGVFSDGVSFPYGAQEYIGTERVPSKQAGTKTLPEEENEAIAANVQAAELDVIGTVA